MRTNPRRPVLAYALGFLLLTVLVLPESPSGASVWDAAAALQDETLTDFTLKKLIGAIIAALVPIVFTVGTFQRLRGRLSLTSYKSEDMLAEVGPTEVPGRVLLDVTDIRHGEARYGKVRILKFQVLNDDSRSFKERTHFLFFDRNTGSLDPGAVVSVHCAPHPGFAGAVDWEREDLSTSGPGIRMKSDVPGGARLQFTLVLDLEAHPHLASRDIVMRKLVKTGEAEVEEEPFKRLILFTPGRFALWIIASAFV